MLTVMRARPDVGPLITQCVVHTVGKIDDPAAVAAEIDGLLKYVEHILVMREIKKQRKQWDEDRQTKVAEAIAVAMKEWDDQHYPRLLQATWGWHPFYVAFVANLMCVDFRPPYPLTHSPVESVNVHSLLMEQCQVERVYPMPWSVLLLRCFLKFYRVAPPLVSHPDNGCTPANVVEWSKLAEEGHGDGYRAWQLATAYLKDEGYLVFAGARPLDSQDQWLDEATDAAQDLLNATPEWCAELQMWLNATRYRAVRDMAFHDEQAWMKAWVMKDRPPAESTTLSCYMRWLQYQEDLDIGYVLAKPELLVTPLVPQEYMYELHNIAENIARERCDYSEVRPQVQSEPECEESVEVQHPVAEDGGNAADAEDGPAFSIPMTQGKTLVDLPSQMDFDWQYLVSPKGTPAEPTGMAVPPKDPDESAFLEVQQIAEEAVVHATQQAGMETNNTTTSGNT